MSSFIRQMASDRFLLRVAVLAAGGFLFGYDTGEIGGALLFIKNALHAQSNLAQQSIVVSLRLGPLSVRLLEVGWPAPNTGGGRGFVHRSDVHYRHGFLSPNGSYWGWYTGG